MANMTAGVNCFVSNRLRCSKTYFTRNKNDLVQKVINFYLLNEKFLIKKKTQNNNKILTK